MKKILYIYCLLAFLSSCHSELEPELYDTINPTTFFKSEADAKAAVTGLYNLFRANDWNGWFSSSHTGYAAWPETATDIMRSQWSFNQTEYGTWTPTDWLVTPYFWQYKDISKATLLISRIEPIEFSQEELKNRYIAEIKCARGIMAFLINDLYGTVPIAPLEVLESPQEEVILPRLTENEMNQFIETDLSEAAQVLPVSYGDADWGRFNKGTALMFLMKHYMNTHQWGKAENTGREILSLGYSLESEYSAVFSFNNQKNNEIIYAVPGNDKWGNMYMTSVLPWNSTTTNPNIMKWGGHRLTWDFYDTFEDGDLRKNVLWDEYTGTDNIVYNRQNPGGQLSKGVVPMKYDEDPNQSGYTSSTDWIVLRYSDALLMLAEAIGNNKGSATQEAVDLINQVRNRSGLEDRTLTDYPDLETFNVEILLERGHELFLEGWRRQDLLRHGKFLEYVRKAQPASQIQDYMTLFPFPQGIIDEGKGIVLQNPGY